MLGGATPSRHKFGSGSGIHAGEHLLIQMAFEETALRRSALRLESAAGAIGRHVSHVALTPVQLLAHKRPASRTAVAVGIRLVDKSAAVEQFAIAPVVDGAVGWRACEDAVSFASAGMGTIGVAGVSHHGQALSLQHLL